MIARRASLALLLSLLPVLFLTVPMEAQCVSLTTLASASTQNFDTLSNTAGSTTNNLTITGWFMTESGGGARDNEQYAVDTGASNTGDTYSYGAAAATDRALGGLRSGTLIPIFGACYTNNTGATLTSLDVGYTGEEWRLGTAARTDQISFEYSLNATSLTTGTWTGVAALNFVTPVTVTAGAKDGNAAANRTVIAPVSIPALSIANGATFWIRWTETDASGADDGLAVDDFSLTPQGGVVNAPVVPTCPANLTTNVGTATSAGVSATDADGTVVSATITSITPSDPGTITLTGFTPAGGVGGTANATLDVTSVTPANNYSVTIQWANNDGSPQTANCVVAVTVNPPPTITFIHDVQGNGAATPIPGATVTIEGVVIGDYQASGQLAGFFLQEEDADADADPATSEGIFVFCSSCPTAVAEGQRVQATGVVSEFNGMTEITASTAPSVLITNAGNNLAQVTPASIDLPVVGVVNDFYEAREGMRVTFVDTLTVAEYFELARFGHIELYEGGRPYQFTEHNAPSVAGYNAHLADLDRRRVIVDDDNNNQNGNLTPFQTDGMQFVYHPRANGGLSIGTQGTDFFRGGDLVNGLTGVLHWSFPGTGADTWRIRPTAATPATFTVANPRPATPPTVGGAIRAAGMNMLNYFTTIDTTASNSSGPCGPGGTLDCRGADSVAELNRQRERASIVICTINPDVAGLVEMENTAAATITDLVGAVNTLCGGAHPYTFVNTGGTVGTDAIRNFIIYRTGVLSPVGAALVDLDSVHNRPPTAQTFDVVDALNPAFGERFTFIPNHFKSKGCGGGAPGDADAGDGAGCFNETRTDQAGRMLTWITGTVLPAAGDPDVLMVGDFNAYASEDPVTTLEGGGFSDLTTTFLGPTTYSYLFDGQLGHLDFAFASASLLGQVTGANNWHINADEIPLFDYSDEIKDTGESAFEEKPDGSALVPPRVVFQPASPYRAADHDPVVVGLFAIADLVLTKTDSPDPVTAGNNLTYTITVTNNGPDVASSASWSDTIPAGTTFVSLSAVAGWSCTTPAVGANGTITCNNASMAVGSSVFTLTVNVAASTTAGTVLTNNATVTSAAGEANPGDETGTATTTVAASSDLSLTKTDSPDPVTAGNNLTYQITLTNNGPSNAASASFTDTLPAGTTFVSLSTTGAWSCTTPAIGATGTVACTNPSFGVTVDFFTIVVNVDSSVAVGTVLSNTASISSATTDANTGNESDTATTTVATSADLSVTKTDSPDPVTAGNNLTYTITVDNAGPSNAASVSLSDTLPASTTFVSISSPGGWSCTTPAVGATGTVTCTMASFAAGSAVFTLTVNVDPSTASGTVITNNATVSSTTSDPNTGNETGTATTTVDTSADLSVSKVDTPDPVSPAANLTYTITVNNAGPSNAFTVSLSDTLPTGTTFVSLAPPGGWSCTTPAVGGTGLVNCTIATLAPGNAVFTLIVNVDGSVATGTVLTNTATVSATNDSNTGNDSATATTTVGIGSADLSVTITDSPDPVMPDASLTYTITVNNAGTTNANTATLSVPVPANTTFTSLSAPGGWSCTTPAVGGTGTVNCTHANLGLGDAVFTLVVDVNPAVAPNSILTATATVSSATTDPNTGNESDTETTTVLSPANVTGTKSASGTFVPGSTVTYTIVLTNSGPATQADNPGAEFTDILPPQLTLVSATSSSGSVGVSIGTNTVIWNGSIAPSSSVTITIQATINSVITPGTTITNQGTIAYDADGNGTNESAGTTDDASQPGAANPTSFSVAAVAAMHPIPALDHLGLLALAALLAGLGMLFLRRG